MLTLLTLTVQLTLVAVPLAGIVSALWVLTRPAPDLPSWAQYPVWDERLGSSDA